MIKRILSLLLTVCMVMQLCSILVFAEDYIAAGTCGDNLTWKLSDDGVLTISGSGAMDDYICGTGEGLAPWREWSQEFINKIVFTKDCEITHIGAYAFYAMYSLETITIPDSVKTIGEGAFESSATLSSVSLPDDLTEIGRYVFKFCMSLNKISLPNTLVTIGEGAFFRSGLTSVTLPAGVTSIGNEAFAYGNLSAVHVLGNEPELGEDVFGKYDGGSITTYAPQNSSWMVYNAQWGNVIYIEQKGPTIKEYTTVAGEKTDFYGANVAKKNNKGEIYDLAQEYYLACNEYLDILKDELDKEAEASEAIKTDEEMAEYLMERDKNSREPALTPAATIKDDEAAMMALYTAYAKYLKLYTDKGIEMNRINVKDNHIKISASLVQDIQKAITVSNYYVVDVDGCKVTFNTWLTGQGTATIRKNRVTHQVFVNTKTLDEIAEVLEDYVNELLDVAHDAMKQTLSGVISDIANVTGFADWEKNEIKSALKKAVKTLKDCGMGDAYTMAERCRQGYALLKDLLSAKDADSLKDFFDSSSEVEKLYKEINKLDFSDTSVTNKSIDQAIEKISGIKGKLANALYSYYTNLPAEEDKGFFDKVSSWFESLIQCPVDFEVFDENGTCIGSVRDGVVECDDSIHIEVRGDVKRLCVPADQSYTLKLYATDEGTMNYVLERFENGEPKERYNYYDIELTERKEFEQTIDAACFNSGNAPVLTTETGDISHNSYYAADDKTAYAEITAEASEAGVVFGGGSYALGDSVELTALPTEENYSFLGWFEGDEVLSTDITYRFTALEDKTIRCEFGEITLPTTYLHLIGESDYLLEDGYIRDIPADTTVGTLLGQFENDKDNLKVYDFNGEEITDEATFVETGFTVMLTVENEVIDGVKTVVLTEEGEEQLYTISFNTLGGSEIDAITQEYDSVVAEPEEPIRSGYLFCGWYADEECTEKYLFAAMPAENITVYAKWEVRQYSWELTETTGGAVTVAPESPSFGENIIITVLPDSGMETDTVTVVLENGESVDVKNTGKGTFSFEQPAGNVIVSVTFKAVEPDSEPEIEPDLEPELEPETKPEPDHDNAPEDNGFDYDSWHWALMMLYNQEFAVNVSASEGGSVTPAGISKVKYDKNITYKFNPDEGYAVADVLVDGKSIGAVSEYAVKRIREDHTITVIFTEIPWQNPFSDVDESDWFYEDVKYMTENGLMLGINSEKTLFSPATTLTRAMLVTVLWRLEEEPVVNYLMNFNDVESEQWYTEAIRWAASVGIVNGYGNGSFGTNDAVTREQIMAILHRYAAYKELDSGMIFPMLPQHEYSIWAENDILWADMVGLTDNIGVDIFDMTEDASRAEIAAYLRRFCEGIGVE